MSQTTENPVQKKRTVNLSQPSRLWFLGKGCRQVPPDYIGGKILWAHPDGYFLNQYGQRLAHDFSPAMQRGFTAANPSSSGHRGSCYPKMNNFGGKNCHVLMALAFYGPRPLELATGKPCSCHHLINKKLDYKPQNLLCWLTKEQHREADRRQRALIKKLLERYPCGETKQTVLYRLNYTQLCNLQDPRRLSNERFERIMESYDILTNDQDPMERDMNHHCEI